MMKFFPGTMEHDTDSDTRAAENGGDGSGIEIKAVSQPERGGGFRVKDALGNGPDIGGIIRALRLIAGINARRVLGVGLGFAFVATPVINREAGCDGEEPSGEGASGSIGVQTFPCTKEGFLGQILRTHPAGSTEIAAPPKEADQAKLVALHKFTERRQGAALREQGELLIGAPV